MRYDLVREVGRWRIDDIKGSSDGGRLSIRKMLTNSLKELTGDDMSDVINNKDHHRYELEVEGHLATEHYKLDGNVITFEHTDVPKELGGKGVGSKLVQGALDQVRAAGLKLIPECPFVKAWIEKHPAYADLVKR